MSNEFCIKNQNAVDQQMNNAVCDSVDLEKKSLVFSPTQLKKINAVRLKFSKLGITENDINDAVQWARRNDC